MSDLLPEMMLRAIGAELSARAARPKIELLDHARGDLQGDDFAAVFVATSDDDFDALAYAALIPTTFILREVIDAARCWLASRGRLVPSDDQLEAVAVQAARDTSAPTNARAAAAHRLAQMGRPSPWPTPALEPIEPGELVPGPAAGAVEVAARGPLPSNVIPIWTH